MILFSGNISQKGVDLENKLSLEGPRKDFSRGTRFETNTLAMFDMSAREASYRTPVYLQAVALIRWCNAMDGYRVKREGGEGTGDAACMQAHTVGASLRARSFPKIKTGAGPSKDLSPSEISGIHLDQ